MDMNQMSTDESGIKMQEETASKLDNEDHRALLLKFEFEGKQYDLANLTMNDTVSDLRAVICAMLNIDHTNVIQLKTLRPTRVIDNSENESKLSKIFSQTRERIVVERRLSNDDYGTSYGSNDMIAASSESSEPSNRSYKPTLKHHKSEDKTTSNLMENVDQSSPGPKPLQQQQQPNKASQSSTNSDESPLRQRKIPQEQQHQQSQNQQAQQQNASQSDQMPVCSSTGYFLRHPVPANNSCLFISVHYCLTNGTVDDRIGRSMRKIIADTVDSDREKYDDAFLGKSNSEYCAWILDDNNWGGAIELSILCKYYNTEIVAIDVKNLILNRFGEDSHYKQRMLLLYDGLHYDPLKFQPYDENRPIITMFPIENTEALTLGLQVARELKQTHQFTDLNTITMICCTCDAHLDAKNASQHAAETGHTNFKETA